MNNLAANCVLLLSIMGFVSLTVMGFRYNKPELIQTSATTALSAAIALAVPKQDG